MVTNVVFVEVRHPHRGINMIAMILWIVRVSVSECGYAVYEVRCRITLLRHAIIKVGLFSSFKTDLSTFPHFELN